MKKVIQSKNAPSPIGPYNQAILMNGCLYVSGQIALNATNGELITESIEAECKQVLKNLKSIIEAAGMSLNQVVKCSIFLKDLRDFDRINQVYAEYFDEADAPARECVQVVKLPKDVNLEISAIAMS